MMRDRALLPIALALLLALTACGDNDPTPFDPDPVPATSSQVRVVHASPDAPPVDVYAEGVATPLFSGLAYGETSDYIGVAAGTYVLEVRPAGADPSSTPAFETGPVDIPADVTITAIAAGLLSDLPVGDGAFRILPLVEEFQGPGAGNAAVRVVHGAGDAPTVALDLGDDGAPEYTNLPRFMDTGAAGLPLPGGQALQIAILNEEDSQNRVTAFTTPELPAGANLFVIATGRLAALPREDDGFSLLAVAATGSIGFIKQNPTVYALHASPDTGAVDISTGGSLLVNDLAFGQISAPLQVPPASYALDFSQGATDYGSQTTPELAAGETYLAIASGFSVNGPPAFQLLPYVEGFDDVPASSALVRGVHSSPDAPPVDIGIVDMGFTPIPGWTNVSFGDATAAEGTPLPAASPVTLGIAQTGMMTTLFEFTVTPVATTRLFAVAAGSVTGVGGSQTFRLILVNATSAPWASIEVTPDP